MSGNTRFCDGLYDLVDSYDGFILDQWGVLHDGIKPYDGVLNALRQLKAHNKQVIILSNSGKRSEYNVERLSEYGIKKTMYRAVVSAGEVTWQNLKDRHEGGSFRDLEGKHRCYLITRGNDNVLLDGLDDIELVEDVEDAEFILITGTDAPQKTMDDYEPLLRRAAVKRIPVVCANPDEVTVFGRERAMGPGALAKKYQEFGGVSHMIGKPYAPIFRHCINQFDGVIPSRTVVIGDSLHHDVAGANALDIDAVFIMGGLHGPEFREDLTEDARQRHVEHLIHQYGARPLWVMDHMIWQSPEAARLEKIREMAND
ncbi:MAG: TIGR01459 family HAD-type hydrolase [Pseudomonadota bacterium]|nr:TIGR01459 family HAD-type hydrolase [Pseudomonadota bacterium]QKK04869.1 MAG: TIGR01459 family HAD-type hydrolase [Pseudomonadota bacterium]